MSYNGAEIVELLNRNEKWSITTLKDAYFICKTLSLDENKYIRKIEGSIDHGVTWKTRYAYELQLLGEEACKCLQWRVKE